MDQEFEIRHLDLGRAALMTADWIGVDKELQAFYADYPSNPLLRVKALILSAYSTSRVVPSGPNATKKLLVQTTLSPIEEPQFDKCVSSIAFIKSALELTKRDDWDAKELFVDIAGCFLDIAWPFLFSKTTTFSEILQALIPLGEACSNAKPEWMIILYLADCNARLHPVYAAQDLVERCQDFDKARQLAKSQVSCAQLFYACIAPLCLTGDIDRVFSEWPTEPAPQIQVRIHKLKASVKDAKLIKANQEQIMGLANDIRKLTEHREKHCLMEGLNVPAITISLASLAVQCNCPELASSLIKSVKNTEKSSELYIRQQYAQTELSLYRLDKTHDTSKCLRVLEALSYTITEAKEHISLHHILEEGCVLIWNALIPVLHEKEPPMDQLSHILVGCSDALEAIKGRNHILRSKFYLEIASYYNCKNLTPQAAEHVTKGLSLDISGDPIKYEFLLIKKQLIVKGSKEFGLPGEERDVSLLLELAATTSLSVAKQKIEEIAKLLMASITTLDEVLTPEGWSASLVEKNLDEPTEEDLVHLLKYALIVKNIEDTLNRFSIGKSARDLEDLASIAKAGLIIANRAVSVSWVKNTHTGYFAKVKSILYIFRARAVIILCLFGPQLDVSSLNKEKTFVLENLTGAIDMASEIGIDTIVFNGAVEMWNLYRSIKTDTIGAEKEWLNLFIKLCPVLNKLRMKDSSIFVNMSAASVLLILDEYKTASETKSKFKAGAKPGKEDQSLVFLSQADEICQSAISKTNASFESTVYIITVWAQLLCVKTEAGMEPIEDQGDLVRLLSSLELAELSAGSQITVDVQSVLSKAVCSFKNSKITSQSIQLETLLRVTQVAMKKDLLKFSYGCLQELQAVGVNEISQSPETKKLLCDFGLIYGQVLLRLLGKSELYTTRANMVAEAFGAFIKCFESSLGLTGDLKFLRNKSLEGILLLLTEWQSSLDLHSACICVKNAVSLLKEGPKVSSSRRNLDNLIQKDIVCTLLERVLDICIGLKWQELGIAICDMWDNVTPKDTKCNIQRYRVLGLTGLSSPVIKLSEEDMARVWLQTAQQARNFQEKEAAFTKCIHHASKCSLKLEAYISYAEWKVTENCSTVAQDILDDIKCIIDPSNESDTPRSISADLLKLRALCLLSKTEASIETKANFIDRAKELLRSLVETTQANSINFMPVAEEAVKDTSKKGKKEPNKESNSAKSANAEDLPGEDGWQSYTWSAAAHNCFLNCQIPTCFSRHSVPDRRSLLSSILVLAEEAGLSNLLDAFFISIRVIELVSLKESKEMLATTSLMEMDVLYRNGQTPANLEKYKKSHFYRLSSVSDYKSNITMVPQAMIIQAKLHLKYGDALNAKKCLSDVLKFDGVIQEPIIKLEAVSLLSLCFYLLGDYEKSHALASKSLANAPSPFIFTNSSLVLLISWSAKDICQKKDQLAFISSCTDRLVSLVASNENGEACRSLMFLFWVKLRILVSTVDNTSEQYLETLKKTYQDCLKWSRVSTKMERYAPIQLDFFKGLKKAVSMSPKNARRQVFNFTVNVAKDIQDYLEFKSGNLDETDYELLIEVAGFELDSPLHSSETKVSRTIEDMLDDYLGEPILAIPMKSCERLINLDFEALPVRLRGAALFLAGTYTEKFSDTGNPDVKEPLQFFSGSISPLVTNGSKEFLMKALERVIDKQISEDPMKAFKSMVLHQAVEPTLFLAKEYTRTNKMTRGNILECVSPWIKTITNIDLTISDLSETSERIRSLTSLKEDINLNDIPRSTRILLVQHMFDKKHIHVGVIRKKKDFAKSKLSGDASFEAFVAKKAVDVQKLQGLEASLDKLRASRQKEPASGESNLSASQEVMATYLSILSESPEICEMLKPSTTPPTPESAKRPAPPKGGKGAVAAAPVPVEVSHVVLLTDDIISRLPLEPFVFESFGITSVSRDFSLQTFLERYRSNVPVPAVNADPKKKPNAAPENDSSAMVFSGISYLTETSQDVNFIKDAISRVKEKSKTYGVHGMTTGLEFNAMLSDYAAFVYSGRQFNESKFLELAMTMPFPGPHATVILEHDRQVNLGTGNISAERQRRLAAHWTLLGSDAILLPNTPIPRGSYEEFVTKLTGGMELGKVAVQSSSVRSTTPVDSLKIPSVILYGVNASLNF